MKELRCFGLLIGIELQVGRRWSKLLPQATLLAMLRHHSFPVLVGYCQCAPRAQAHAPFVDYRGRSPRRLCNHGCVLRRSRTSLLASSAWQTAVRPGLARLHGKTCVPY